MESSKKTSVILWACAAAAGAGILGVSLILRVRQQQLGASNAGRLRNVQDVLADCYRKIHEIEDHLPDLPSARAKRTSLKVVGNGHPV